VVQDIRKIIFTTAELMTAFESYGRTSPKFMPNGRVIACIPTEQDGIQITIAMRYGSSTHNVDFIYRGLDVLRPLILFCIENNIMLPRNGQKTFAIIDGRATVSVELNLDTELSMECMPMRSEHLRLITTNGQPETEAVIAGIN